jgi:hypothetical protein
MAKDKYELTRHYTPTVLYYKEDSGVKKAKNDVQCGYFMVYNKLNSLDNVTMKRH